MIFGVGTDILEVARMEKLVTRGGQYLDAVFTAREREYCEHKARSSEHFAARYAAKEAFLKALGTGWRDGLAYSDIEITNDELGKPQVSLHGKVKELYAHLQIKQTSLSISHISKIAMAVVILDK
jgi:holo-[acyl-carrier protein] synthase